MVSTVSKLFSFSFVFFCVCALNLHKFNLILWKKKVFYFFFSAPHLIYALFKKCAVCGFNFSHLFQSKRNYEAVKRLLEKKTARKDMAEIEADSQTETGPSVPIK